MSFPTDLRIRHPKILGAGWKISLSPLALSWQSRHWMSSLLQLVLKSSCAPRCLRSLRPAGQDDSLHLPSSPYTGGLSAAPNCVLSPAQHLSLISSPVSSTELTTAVSGPHLTPCAAFRQRKSHCSSNSAFYTPR